MKCPWQRLSVFFPVFNEADALPRLIERTVEVLEGMGLADYEVIVVDDGSSDDTGRIADDYARNNMRVRVVHHEQNRGFGAALISGFEAAQYEWVAYTDGDGQFDFGDIERFYEPSTRVDVVLGYRRRRNDHVGRKLNAWVWGRVVRLILGLKVHDLDCGFKLFRTERVRALAPLQSQGAVISAELLVKLAAADCKWEQVMVEHYPRQGGAPTGASWRVIGRALRELVGLRRRVH